MTKNKYGLKAIVNKNYIEFKKQYNSRSEALEAAFRYLGKNYIFGVSIEDEFTLNNDKHNVEYVLSNEDRLIVNRL